MELRVKHVPFSKMFPERRMDTAMFSKAQSFRDQQGFCSVQHRLVRQPNCEVGLPVLTKYLSA